MDTDKPRPILDNAQMDVAVKRAIDRFKQVCKKYRKLKAWAVLSSPLGQVALESPPGERLKSFPDMVVDSAAKAAARKALKEIDVTKEEVRKGGKDPQQVIKDEDERRAKTARLIKELEALAPKLSYYGDTQVELRFHVRKYRLIWLIKKDAELVDQELTMQRKASIRIVLGTLAKFAELT